MSTATRAGVAARRTQAGKELRHAYLLLLQGPGRPAQSTVEGRNFRKNLEVCAAEFNAGSAEYDMHLFPKRGVASPATVCLDVIF